MEAAALRAILNAFGEKQKNTSFLKGCTRRVLAEGVSDCP
jgi:hypothetical protein